VNRPATVAPLVDRAPRPLREYVEQLEHVVGDDFRLDRIGASHAGDPETSTSAARLNFPRSGNQRRRVLEALAARTQGATFEELIADTGIKSAAKRLTELVQGGWAIQTDATRLTSQGAKATVHLVSERALQELERDRRAGQSAGGEGSAFRGAGPMHTIGQAPCPPGGVPSSAGNGSAVRGGEPDAAPKLSSSTAVQLFGDEPDGQQPAPSAFDPFSEAA
jgi:hypothetical protein